MSVKVRSIDTSVSGTREASDIPRHRVSLRRCRGENPCRPRSAVVGKGEIGRQANEVSAVRGADARSVGPPSHLQSERGRPPRHRLPVTFVRDFGVRFFCARVRGVVSRDGRATLAREYSISLSLSLSFCFFLSVRIIVSVRRRRQENAVSLIATRTLVRILSRCDVLRRQLQSDTQPSVSSPPTPTSVAARAEESDYEIAQRLRAIHPDYEISIGGEPTLAVGDRATLRPELATVRRRNRANAGNSGMLSVGGIVRSECAVARSSSSSSSRASVTT